MGISLVLLPAAGAHWKEIRGNWERQRKQAILVGILCPLSYLLILTALVLSPVSYIAPAREISILIGVLMGARVLAEGHPKRRLTAAAMMVCGVAALAIG